MRRSRWAILWAVALILGGGLLAQDFSLLGQFQAPVWTFILGGLGVLFLLDFLTAPDGDRLAGRPRGSRRMDWQLDDVFGRPAVLGGLCHQTQLVLVGAHPRRDHDCARCDPHSHNRCVGGNLRHVRDVGNRASILGGLSG